MGIIALVLMYGINIGATSVRVIGISHLHMASNRLALSGNDLELIASVGCFVAASLVHNTVCYQ